MKNYIFRNNIFLLFMLWLIGSITLQAQKHYYIDPELGNDNNSGSFQQPFRTLEKMNTFLQSAAVQPTAQQPLIIHLKAQDNNADGNSDIVHVGFLEITKPYITLTSYANTNAATPLKAIIKAKIPQIVEIWSSLPKYNIVFGDRSGNRRVVRNSIGLEFSKLSSGSFDPFSHYAASFQPFFIKANKIQDSGNESARYQLFYSNNEPVMEFGNPVIIDIYFGAGVSRPASINNGAEKIMVVPKIKDAAITIAAGTDTPHHITIENIHIEGSLNPNNLNQLTNQGIPILPTYNFSGIMVSANQSLLSGGFESRDTCRLVALAGLTPCQKDPMEQAKILPCIFYYMRNSPCNNLANFNLMSLKTCLEDNCEAFKNFADEDCKWSLLEALRAFSKAAKNDAEVCQPDIENIIIQNVEVENCARHGIEFMATPYCVHRVLFQDGSTIDVPRYVGIDSVVIKKCLTHHNGNSGIHVGSSFDGSGFDYYHKRYTITQCESHHNFGIANSGDRNDCARLGGEPGGNGIFVSNINQCNINRCVAHHNGENNMGASGGEGIWAFEAKYVTIQYCESYQNSSYSLDGGGFDFDGGVSHSIMKYNYSHDNRAMGFLINQTHNAAPMHHDTLCYNISINDVKDTARIFSGACYPYHYGAITVWTDGRSHLKDIYIFNNVTYKTNTAPYGYALKLDAYTPENGNTPLDFSEVYIFNNIFQNNLGRLVHISPHLLNAPNSVSFYNNNYYTSSFINGAKFIISLQDAPAVGDIEITFGEWVNRVLETGALNQNPSFVNISLPDIAYQTGVVNLATFEQTLRSELSGFKLKNSTWFNKSNPMYRKGSSMHFNSSLRDFFSNPFSILVRNPSIGIHQP
ncbi:MAG: right-handed parallel beta-helix repeat-containing protein [Sphingobacteriales bacterium]|nr:right-handed parallel beta-helix repeat-containing protein [Sphingobacteriales bacterium]